MASPLAIAAEYLPFVPRPAPKFVTEDGTRVHGIVAEFDTPADVYHAAEKVRDAGYKKWDVHTPFPIHGMEEAMGVKRTILPLVSFGAAVSGVIGALLLQYYTNAWDYEFVVQGKNPRDWEAYIPVTFELGILLCAFATLFGMFALNGLPRFHHPLFSHERFLKTSDDRFMVAIEAEDEKFDPDATRALLESAGGNEIEIIEDED